MTARTPHPALRLLAHGVVFAVAATMVLPFAWMLLTSVKAADEAMTGGVSILPRSWRFDNYAEAVRSASLDRYYVNSIVVAVLTTVLAGFYNAAAGYAFAKLRFTGRTLLFRLTLATMMLPVQVSFLFAYQIAARLGFIDNVQALVIPFLASGFGIYYMRQAVAEVPDSLLEAGRLDGMGELDLFWTLVRPSVWPAAAALGIFSFVNSWNNFFWALVVIDTDANKTLPLAVAELASGQYVQSWPVRMAAATIITLPLLIVFVIFQRAFVRGIALTGLKE